MDRTGRVLGKKEILKFRYNLDNMTMRDFQDYSPEQQPESYS